MATFSGFSSRSSIRISNEYAEDGSLLFWKKRHGRSILTELDSQRKTGEFLDLLVRVDGREFPCHRAVLGSTPYFKAMLSSNLAESKSKVVQLHGVDPISFSKILDFLYTGEICIGKDDVQDILQAAHMLQFDTIVECCREFMGENICRSNCLGVMHLADIYNLSDLKYIARSKAVSKFSSVVETEDFLRLPACHLLDILTDEDLQVAEEDEVVRSVIRWLDHDPESRKTAVTMILPGIHLSRVRVSVLRLLESHAVIRESPECLAKITAAKEEHLTRTGQASEEMDEPCSYRRRILYELAIIFGGWKVDRYRRYKTVPLHGMFCLDPNSDNYYHVTNLPTPVLGYMSVASAGKRLYMTGGRAHPLVGQGPQSAPSRRSFCYDFSSDTWMELPDMPLGRAEHQSVVVDGKLFLVGGDVEVASELGMDCYDIAEEVWMAPSSLPTVGTSSGLILTACMDKVVLIGTIPPEVIWRRGQLCVHAFDKKTEHWVMSDIDLDHSVRDRNIFTSVDDVIGWIYISVVYSSENQDVYSYDVKNETLMSEGNSPVHMRNRLRTKCDSHRLHADAQTGIIDKIVHYGWWGSEDREIPLPYALFGHAYLETKKSTIGWYCRDLEKLESEDEEWGEEDDEEEEWEEWDEDEEWDEEEWEEEY